MLYATVAWGHEASAPSPLPDASAAPVDRGIALARYCEHVIHDLLDEYAFCVRSSVHDLDGNDEAVTAFYFMAWLRAASAALHGYPNGEAYRDRFRAAFLAASAKHPIASEQLCAAANIDCAKLPEPIPQPQPNTP